ncbi:hypothetical protein D3C73_1595400 [compost metagenome]
MHSRLLNAALNHWEEVFSTFHTMAVGTVAFCVQHKVRITIIQAEILKPHLSLLPANHAVAIIA